jgi:hypothetical protein
LEELPTDQLLAEMGRRSRSRIPAGIILSLPEAA